MNRRLASGLVLACTGALLTGAVAFGAPAKSGPKRFTAALNVGQETGVVKSSKGGAAGHFTATLNGTTLTYRLTFAHLSGAATAAHIHGPAGRHVNAAVLVPLCAPCTSPLTQSINLTHDQIDLMERGKTYVNVHTGKNPNGEIRGQIVAIHR
jgi:hypothetical protein